MMSAVEPTSELGRFIKEKDIFPLRGYEDANLEAAGLKEAAQGQDKKNGGSVIRSFAKTAGGSSVQHHYKLAMLHKLDVTTTSFT